MTGEVRVGGRLYPWAFERVTDAYPGLTMHQQVERPDVLRIRSPGTGFDVAILAGGHPGHFHLHPLLVLGGGFPDEVRCVPVGSILELRPKTAVVYRPSMDDASVQRIVQWCTSARFRPRPARSQAGIRADQLSLYPQLFR